MLCMFTSMLSYYATFISILWYYNTTHLIYTSIRVLFASIISCRYTHGAILGVRAVRAIRQQTIIERPNFFCCQKRGPRLSRSQAQATREGKEHRTEWVIANTIICSISSMMCARQSEYWTLAAIHNNGSRNRAASGSDALRKRQSHNIYVCILSIYTYMHEESAGVRLRRASK